MTATSAPGGVPPRRGPLAPTATARLALRPVADARITGGFWQPWRAVNATVNIPGGLDQLEHNGNLPNLRVARSGTGEAADLAHPELPFLDSDLYKWLEAAAWAAADGTADPAVAGAFDRSVELLAAVQEPDGYLQSHFQVARPGSRFTDLQWGHELYCAGHLIQAGVADSRATGRTALLQVATRFADLIDATFGPGRTAGVPGHPELETALVELFRETGEQRYLRLAGYFVDGRGHGLLPGDRFGRDYFQDRVPVRQATTVVGHAVRQLYLLAGAADVAAETGDDELLAAVIRLWDDLAGRKLSLTGGAGAHHHDEAFGDRYELPNERAYNETCAAIASIMLSWRLLLATGQARYADLMERTLYNGFLSGVAADGGRYRYVNPLRMRADHDSDGAHHEPLLRPWFGCACCPPNVMRLLASLPHYLAAAGGDRLVVHQYAAGELAATVAGQPARIRVDTAYPAAGRIRVEVTRTGPAPWTLALRVPGWCPRATVAVTGAAVEPPRSVAPADGWLELSRRWQAGDVVELDLDVAPRFTAAPWPVDAVRGAVAVEVGPLVYCLESVDQRAGTDVDAVEVDVTVPPVPEPAPGAGPAGALPAVRLAGFAVAAPDSAGTADTAGPAGSRPWWPYPPVGAEPELARRPVALTAVPYHAWGQRARGGMRVWLPAAPPVSP